MLTLIGHTFAYCLIAVIIALTICLVAIILRGLWEMMRNWNRAWSIQAVQVSKPEPYDEYSLGSLAMMQDLPKEL